MPSGQPEKGSQGGADRRVDEPHRQADSERASRRRVRAVRRRAVDKKEVVQRGLAAPELRQDLLGLGIVVHKLAPA